MEEGPPLWKIQIDPRDYESLPQARRERRLENRKTDPETTAFIDRYTSLADAVLKPKRGKLLTMTASKGWSDDRG